MRALFYLLRVRLKNVFLSMLKKPSQLVLIVFVLAMIVFTVISTRFDGDQPPYGTPDQFEAVIFAFYSLMFVIGLSAGLKRGAGFFALSDVNILFNAPISNKKVLMYGLIRQFGTIALGGFFILYQYSWLHNLFGIQLSMLFLILLGYVLVILSSQILAMLIYSATSSNEYRQKLVTRCVILLFAGGIVALILPVLKLLASGTLPLNRVLPAIVDSVARSGVAYVPILGWMADFIRGCFDGDGIRVLLPVAATLLLNGLLILIFMRMDVDYYEDVLQAAETSYAALTAQKQGKIAEVLPSKIKIGQEGINRGLGASAIYYKHAVENRRAQVFFLDTMSLIFIAVTALVSFFLREEGTLIPLAVNVYMLVFSTVFSRWLRELERHYIYLIPEKPFKKLLYLMGDNIKRRLIVSVLIGGVIGINCGAGIAETAGVIAVHFTASLIFIAAVVLSERVFGAIPIKWLQTLFVFLTIFVCAAPGIVVGIVVGIAAGSFAPAYFAFSGVSLVLAVLIFFFSKGLLTASEVNG